MVTELKTVYAVILNYNSYNDTIDCIQHLLKSTYAPLKIIVVDNHSPNQSTKYILTWLENEMVLHNNFSFFEGEDANIHFQSKITIIKAAKNGGFAKGNNIALAKLQYLDGFIFMVNPDVIVESDTVESLVHNIQGQVNKAILGCSFYDYDTKAFQYSGVVQLKHLTGTVNELDNDGSGKVDYICGGAVFFHSKALQEIGLLPEDYFLYWEDADWCFVAKQKGYFLKNCKEAKVYDKGATSIGRGYVAEYYYTRNALIFHKKYGFQVYTIIVSNLLFRLPKKILLRQWNRAKAVMDGTIDFILKKYINAPQKNIHLN